MPQPVLATPAESWTRLRAPSPAATSIGRPHLDDAIDDLVRRHRVAVVAAPSGYGKTTAVGSWAARRAELYAWLSLGAFDNEDAQLRASIIATLHAVAADSGLTALQPLLGIDRAADDDATVYRTICDAAAHLEQPLHLVIDDAHRAGDALTRGLLGALIEHAPETMRVVLVGTSPLELLLPRLALTEPEVFLGARTLAFTPEEIAGLVELTGSSLGAQRVHDETQGWPIAVRAVLLGGAMVDPARTPGDDSLIREESLLREYVHRHILDTLMPDLGAFILDCSVCTDVTADLAEAVTGRADAGELLEECVRRGLFLERFDHRDHPVYRWHAVFARQCVVSMHTDSPERLRELHRRAAAHLALDDPLASISHSVRAGDLDAALETLHLTWASLVVGAGAASVAAVCAGLPAELADDPGVLLVRACAQDSLGEHTVARTMFAAATARLEHVPVDERTNGTLLLARLFLTDDRTGALAASNAVRDALAGSARFGSHDRAAVLYLVGWAELRQRLHPGLMIEYLTAAANEARSRGDLALERRALSNLATAHAWSGRLTAVRGVLDRLGATDDLSSPWAYYSGGGAACASGIVAYWGGDLTGAFRDFSRLIASGTSRTAFGGVARLMLALSAAASGDPRMCRRAADEVRWMPTEEANGLDWPVFRDATIAVLSEAAGRQPQALAICAKYSDADKFPLVAVALSGILRRAGDHAAAYRLLGAHRAFAEVSYVDVALKATAAVVRYRRGEVQIAHEHLEAALDRAAAEGIRLIFMDGDPWMRRLLSEHLVRPTAHEAFIADCLAEPRDVGALSALSAREREVFRLLQTRKTMQEIAAELGLSVNTVKTHQRAIYRKLGVSSRREAQAVVD